MAETTQINKYRQKKLRSISTKPHKKDDEPISSYFYPKNSLYTRQEFELLDTIYSEESPTFTELKEEEQKVENFWPQNKEEYINFSKQSNNFLAKLGWFLSGVALSSLIWFICFQLNVNHFKTKYDTQIIFQKSAAVVTDKTVDEEITKKLQDKKVQEPQVAENAEVKKQVPQKQNNKFNLSNIFGSKKAVNVSLLTPQKVQHHTVVNGDSLWIIANKYYLDPSPANIDKIMKANNLKRAETLYIGQKIVIPQ